ncbi:hypothetical protein LIER_11492 [Lithospermum erythrorhizon]|uniref:Uncharacterized protein n=1 Tax=Lithospermum erythrorhizon TaxID=34254 RepID=A0AAV3PN91_LITER
MEAGSKSVYQSNAFPLRERTKCLTISFLQSQHCCKSQKSGIYVVWGSQFHRSVGTWAADSPLASSAGLYGEV